MANQVSIPYTQTQDPNLNQIQQYVNKVFKNFDNKITSAQGSITQMTILGEVKIADLTLAQFQAQAGTDWIVANGQSCVGTAFETLTGNKTVPNYVITGLMAFIKVN